VNPHFFRTSAELRAWLRRNHASADELLVGLHKKGTGEPSITWSELVDEVLCFGWIDGVRKSIDARSYTIRITPRRKGSIWSAVNLRRAQELIGAGVMEPAGIAAFEARDEEKTRLYSYEREQASLGGELEARFRANARAWAFFQSQPPSYRKNIVHWVVSAKREETRLRRLETLIQDSENGVRVGLLRR
jgi:uncharacterized protein YdeI (YjbR/CyaY-like superfamily)